MVRRYSRSSNARAGHVNEFEEVPMRSTYYSLLVFLLILVICGPLYAAQEETVETKVKTMLLDPATDTPIVVLETVTDKKLVPIWIDIPEARAIALELQHVQTPRPLTHDLIRNIFQSLRATLQRVTITDIRNNTYFATLHLRLQGEEFRIDSRPSDAIAVALRMKAPIYTAVQVLAKSKPLPTPDEPAEQLRRKLGVQYQNLTGELSSPVDVQLLNAAVVTDVASGSLAETHCPQESR
jgi:uncharacterized protein